MVHTSNNDNELVLLCLKGETEAFGQLVSKYQLTMYNTVLNIVQDRDEAKDVLQRAFIKAWERLESFDQEYRFFSWLYRIVINESLNTTRRRKKIFLLQSSLEDPENPFDNLVKKETRQRLSDAIRKLTAEYRAVILLRHFDNLSYAEMADVLNIDEKTVKSRLYSARIKLRDTLNG